MSLPEPEMMPLKAVLRFWRYVGKGTGWSPPVVWLRRGSVLVKRLGLRRDEAGT